MTEEQGGFQFSIRTIFILVWGCAIATLMVKEIPHVAVFAAGIGFVVLAHRAYQTRTSQQHRVTLRIAVIVSWIVLYFLSAGPAVMMRAHGYLEEPIEFVYARPVGILCIAPYMLKPVEWYLEAWAGDS